MNSEADPIVGNWYRHLDKGQAFTVVAIDDDASTVEIQHFDGNLEEIDLDTWSLLPIEPIEEPENWSGPMDVAELDDLGGTEITDTLPEDWSEPLEEIIKQEERPAEEISEEAEEEDALFEEEAPETIPLETELSAEASEKTEEEERAKGGGTAYSEDE
ncbi:DUF6763 family protein [Methylococcus capsulatus]|jgi:hypothetical protein|uniref:Uncharacterized protein n=1 Tax=Methylococcus capsulatus TaxID=414 RepID=A0AA35Y0B8_METCP|nr:DUF6763 family protein [Methylococcus capsulatus]CAI8814010.1 conserved protein of unknown function [Methylococcus capsulatus]